MSEERAVQQVLARYVRGVDARDGAAVAAMFTEDGRVEISYNNSGNQSLSVSWWGLKRSLPRFRR
jgi:hypothetical protein